MKRLAFLMGLLAWACVTIPPPPVVRDAVADLDAGDDLDAMGEVASDALDAEVSDRGQIDKDLGGDGDGDGDGDALDPAPESLPDDATPELLVEIEPQPEAIEVDEDAATPSDIAEIGPDALEIDGADVPTCVPLTECAGDPYPLDALDPCERWALTTDGCACEKVPRPVLAPCDDDDPCTVDDVCFENGACLGSGSPAITAALCDDDNPCTFDTCVPATGCQHEPDDQATCTDGNACTVGDTCQAGACVPGAYDVTACDCTDQVDGWCEAQWGDANVCTGDLICLGGRCQRDDSHTPRCPAIPGFACLAYRCDKDAQGCAFVPLDATPCSDGDPCTTGDTCDLGTCVGTFAPAAGACQCQADADCAPLDDGNACNGTLICLDGRCQVDSASVPAPCDDADDTPCSHNRCQPATGLCAAIDEADQAPCDDGDPCTTGTTCSAGACGAGLTRICPVLWGDCLQGACQPSSGACVPSPVTDGTPCPPSSACFAAGECQSGGCVELSPLDCNDHDACTADLCDGAGACQHVLVPVDTPELCDGQDNDCDGLTDADDADLKTDDAPPCELQAGVCAGVAKPLGLCQGGTWLSCDQGTYELNLADYDAGPEVACDGLDNDCDGLTDEDFAPTATGCGTGACAATGQTTCTNGVEGDSCVPGTPAPDDATCDAIDDDCDGQTDEEYPGSDSTCGAGACTRAGTMTCTEGAEVDSCVPGAPALDDATCDAIDDDCDGVTDEDFPAAPVSCGAGACQAEGTTFCDAGEIKDSCSPGGPAADDTVCNAIDDDCDGATDEDVVAQPTTCGVGACAATGATTCIEGVPGDSCTPGTPAADDTVCNALDDDCDGATDEDVVAQPTTCGVGACAATGATTCTGGVPGDSCTPGAPAADDTVCNGIDDDCDGATDEDFAIEPTACGEGQCAATGLTTCLDGTPSDSCTLREPTDEVCNALDDDCDGATDEGGVCPPELFVDASNVADPLEDGSQAHPFDTLEEAVALLEDFATIHVAAGAYTGGHTIAFDDVTIEGADRATVTLTTASGGTGLSVTGDRVAISGLGFTGGAVGVAITGAAGALIDAGRITDCSFGAINAPDGGAAQGAAIALDYANGATVSFNEVSGVSGGDGAAADLTSPGGRGVGVLVQRSMGCIVEGNAIATVAGGRGPGGTNKQAGPGGQAFAIWLVDATDTSVNANSITGVSGGQGGAARSDAYGFTGGPGGRAAGVELERSPVTRLSGNLLSGIAGGAGNIGKVWGASQQGFGIYLDEDSQPAQVTTDNTLAAQPIVYRYGAVDEVIQGLTLTTTANPTNLGKLVVLASSGVTIRNVEIAGYTAESGDELLSPEAGANGYGVLLRGCDACRIEDVDVHGVRGGVGSSRQSSGSASPGDAGATYGVRVEDSADVTLKTVTVRDLSGANGGLTYNQQPGLGGDVYALSASGTTGLRVDDVTVHTLTGGAASTTNQGGRGGHAFALAIQLASDTRVSHALVYGMTQGQPSKGDTTARAECVWIDRASATRVGHLTCTDVGDDGVSPAAGYGFVVSGSQPDTVVLEDAIFATTTATCLYSSPTNGPGALRASYTDLWECAGGATINTTLGAGMLAVDPKFLGPALGIFTLQAASPCIDAGDPGHAYDGEPGANGCRVNLGAYGNTAKAKAKSGAATCDGGDTDGDGDWNATDCAPTDPAIHAKAREICDGVDNDCDGLTDGDDDVTEQCGNNLDDDCDGLTDESTDCLDVPKLYVDAANLADPDEDGSRAHPFDRIDEALAATAAGTTVHVLPGGYAGGWTIAEPGVRLLGSDRDDVSVWLPAASGGTVGRVTADGVEIAGITFEGGSVGLALAGALGMSIQGGQVHDCAFRAIYAPDGASAAATALHLDYATEVIVSGNTVTDVAGGDGVWGTAGVAGGRGIGVLVQRSLACELTGNAVSGVVGGLGSVGNNQGEVGGSGGAGLGFLLSDTNATSLGANEFSSLRGGTGGNGTLGCCNGGGAGGAGGLGIGVLFERSTGTTLDANAFSAITGGAGGNGHQGVYGATQVGFALYLDEASKDAQVALSNTWAGEAIVYRYGVSGEEIADLSLTAAGNPTNLGKVVVRESSDVTLRNLTVAGYVGQAGDTSLDQQASKAGATGTGIHLVACDGCTVEGTTVYGVRGGTGGTSENAQTGAGGATYGLLIERSDGVRLLDVGARDLTGASAGVCYDAGSGPGGDVAGIRAEATTNLSVEGALVRRVTGGNAWTRSAARGGHATALELNQAAGTLVRHLLAYDVDQGTPVGGDITGRARCVKVDRSSGTELRHLTCTDVGDDAISTGAGYGVVVLASQPDPVLVVDGIVSGMTGGCLENAASNPTTALTATYTLLNACGAAPATNATVDASCPTTDPLFTNGAGGDYHLQATSPAIDAGDLTSAYDQEPAPNGCRVNLGAYGDTAEATPGAGATLHCTAADADGDGDPSATDCAPTDATRFHGAADALCNGIDDDCDGATDEDYTVTGTACGVGACARTGSRSCNAGAVADSCSPGNPAASDATCDNVDDDCDTATDEDYVPVTSCFLPGACAAGNVASTCSGGVVTTCKTGTPGTETCNYVDDNCNGQTDEGTTAADASNCGACGVVCSANHVAAVCSGGACVGDCAPDWADCNGNRQSDGCESAPTVASQGPNSPTTASQSDPGGLADAWTTSLLNVVSSNDAYAKAIVGMNTHWIVATNFGFAIPADATIRGVVVEVEGKVSGFDQWAGGYGDTWQLVKGGVRSGTTGSSTSALGAVDSYVTAGAPTDLWGNSLTAADVNVATFGVAYMARNDDGDYSMGIDVDHLRMTVTYTRACP